MKTLSPSSAACARATGRLPRDPALWAWLIVAVLAMIPATAALHVILA